MEDDKTYGEEGWFFFNFCTSQKPFKFAWSPIRKLMKDNGAEMVARDAVDALIDYLEKAAKGVTNKALEMTRHAGRKNLHSISL